MLTICFFRLDPKLLKEKGIPPGPLFGKIKNGDTITLTDGTVVSTQEPP